LGWGFVFKHSIALACVGGPIAMQQAYVYPLTLMILMEDLLGRHDENPRGDPAAPRGACFFQERFIRQ